MTTSFRVHTAIAVTSLLGFVWAGGAFAAPYPDAVGRAVASHAAGAAQPDAFERAVANHRRNANVPAVAKARNDGFDWRPAALGTLAFALLLGLVAARIARRSRSVAA